MEKRFPSAVDEEEEECAEAPATAALQRRGGMLQRKNKAAIDGFLSSSKRVRAVATMPRYYGPLLTWALHSHIEKNEWRVFRTLGYRNPEPVYIDVSTDCDQSVNLLMNGQILVEKEDARFVVTLEVNLHWLNAIQVEGPIREEDGVDRFIADIMSLAKNDNFYRGKRIEFGERLRFLKTQAWSWDKIVLDSAIKKEIRSNSVCFLDQRELWGRYGIPRRRGILLAGEPGTGKTIICKALMAEASGLTCITTSAYALDADEYLTELYELAEDLSPCIVFIEDIDLIGQNRDQFGYQRGPALLSLLSVLDGIEAKKDIVTLATTNCLETLDKALSQRPSRFDRVVKLAKPSFGQRLEIVSRLCQRIPLSDALQNYVAGKTEGCTPAQVQEVVYSLLIEETDDDSATHVFREQEIDRIVSRIGGKTGHRLGFYTTSNHRQGD